MIDTSHISTINSQKAIVYTLQIKFRYTEIEECFLSVILDIACNSILCKRGPIVVERNIANIHIPHTSCS